MKFPFRRGLRQTSGLQDLIQAIRAVPSNPFVPDDLMFDADTGEYVGVATDALASLLEHLDDQLGATTGLVRILQDAVERRDVELTNLRNELDLRDQDVAPDLLFELLDDKPDIADLQAALAESQAISAMLSDANAQYAYAAEKLQGAIASVNLDNSSLAAALQEMEAESTEQQACIAERSAQIKARDERIRFLEEYIEELKYRASLVRADLQVIEDTALYPAKYERGHVLAHVKCALSHVESPIFIQGRKVEENEF